MLSTLKLSLLASVLAQSALAKSGLNADMDPKLVNSIQKYVDSYSTTYGQDAPSCTISATESCSISKFPKDQTTLVLPGGETRCIYSYSSPFKFQVIPGATDKVIFYFQGGGACWDEASTKLNFCTSDAEPQSLVGIFDRTNVNNKFRDYTIVQVLYCSGDVFGGNVVRPYNDKKGVPVEQKGLANAQSVLDWTKQQQATGALASTLSELVVMGCSAGSIGAQLWGKQVINGLKWKKAAVVPDSYAGIFPPGTAGPLVYDYGFCTSGFLSQALYAKCMDQTLTMQDMDLEFIAATPTVPYTFIQSKVDDVQISFYIAIGLTNNVTDPTINPSEFYDDVNKVFGAYNKLDNFMAYLVDGPQHCFTNHVSIFFSCLFFDKVCDLSSFFYFHAYCSLFHFLGRISDILSNVTNHKCCFVYEFSTGLVLHCRRSGP